jgi:hypothetical protein
MYASAVAETPPVISRVTPRSQVMSETVVMQVRVSSWMAMNECAH